VSPLEHCPLKLLIFRGPVVSIYAGGTMIAEERDAVFFDEDAVESEISRGKESSGKKNVWIFYFNY
jgi:hypothetical protein